MSEYISRGKTAEERAKNAETFLLAEIMRKTRGRADPQDVLRVLREMCGDASFPAGRGSG